MKAVQAVEMPSDTVSSKSVLKGIITTSPATAQAFEATMGVERSKTSKTSNTQKATKNAESFNIAHATTNLVSNVEPLSQSTIPEQEDHDVDWDNEDDVSLSEHLDVSQTPDADSDPLTHNTTLEPPSLDFGLAHDDLHLIT
ncbi:unnamed protein product [Phytophthora fragariaefolia]|uniref:Unnamed protein product n=1 Tax=Phytophthora fragariaefolia TaxID=1490495 RepID=A0A9W6Y7A0_9STRA|nr:unnamed protein product [Phytophthora fragariaefolia]